uniref:Lysine biosynthesis protein LysX n=1 Tax=uncultured bacterium esnapd17 TaxID=1366598 RepID=S5UD38_9BACT|nr:lysine biosynthesis protein LysX [uncultured bacterium esnapd17]
MHDGGAGCGDARPVAIIASRVRVEEKMLVEALRRRGVPHVLIDDRELTYVLGAPAPQWCVAINRSIAASRRLEVSRLCEAWEIPVVNPVETVATCDNKIATMLALFKHGVPVPSTAVALSAAGGPKAVEQVGLPAVVKPVDGSWGRGLAKVNDTDAVESVLSVKETLPSSRQQLVLAQEFVETPHRDVRVVVAGDRAVAAMYRYSEHWIANVARGSRTESCPLTGELSRLAVAAATAVGGGFVGVDLLENPDGNYVVNEVNCGTEFRGLVSASQVPIGDALVDYALDQVPL